MSHFCVANLENSRLWLRENHPLQFAPGIKTFYLMKNSTQTYSELPKQKQNDEGGY